MKNKHDPYSELIVKFRMSEDEFHSKRITSNLFNKVTCALLAHDDPHIIISQLINGMDEAMDKIRNMAELMPPPVIYVKKGR